MTQSLNSYEQNERLLLYKLYELIPSIESFVFTQGRICFDSIVTTNKNVNILIETKVRDMDINKYNTYILQVDKLKGLINRANQNKCEKIYYINFFKTNSPEYYDYIIFDLTPRIKEWKTNPPVVEKRWMNCETHRSRSDKMIKEVIMLEVINKTDAKGRISINTNKQIFESTDNLKFTKIK